MFSVTGLQALFQLIVGAGLLSGSGMMIHSGYQIKSGDWSALPRGLTGAGVAAGGAAILKALSGAFGVPSIFNGFF